MSLLAVIAAGLCLALGQPPEAPAPAPPAEAAEQEPRWSVRSRVVDLMADPDTFEVMQRHIPRIIAQIEFSTGITFPLDFTLEDFIHVPEADLDRKRLDAIDAELALIR